MLEVIPGDATLGARIVGVDLAKPLAADDRRRILLALGRHGVLCFPDQKLGPVELRDFSANFGSLELNVARSGYHHSGMPEVMTLSNIVSDGKPIGFPDAGMGWHSDLSYSQTIAFVNILHALEVPHDDAGRPLGGTAFANTRAAYEGLPEAVKQRLDGATATHDYAQLWEWSRRMGSKRGPLTPEMRAAKPPVSHPVFLTHPITGKKVIYANPGYAARIDGWPEAESREMLDFLFRHQTKTEYLHTHHWRVGDLLIWDNLQTVHKAIGDYGPDRHRHIIRCQVGAGRIFQEGPGLAA
jgi:alpha-ketoglutarate-dependent taurine dioxygenase